MPDLFAELIEAFPPRPLYPGLLVDTTGMWNTYPNDKEFEAGVPGQSWDTLTPEFVEYHCDALTWMNLDAFAAFLPAYLASLLRGDTHNELPPLVLLDLTRRVGWEDEFDARAAHLTRPQRAAIVHVLKALAKGERFDHYRTKIEVALDSWRGVLDMPAVVPAAAVTSTPRAPAASLLARPTVGVLPATRDGEPDRSSLLEAILEAFPPRPFAPEVLADPTGIWNGNTRATAFEAGIRGQSWSTLMPEFVAIHNCALLYMTPDAYAVFAPAYLAWLLRENIGEAEPVLRALAPEVTQREKWDQRAARFTSEQRAVIVRVLETLARDDYFARHRKRIDAALDSWRAVLARSTPSPK